MKKTLLIFALCLCIFSSKAQDIIGLDEVALLGTWEVKEHGGLWENIGYRWPKKFEFNDGKKSYLYTKGNRETHQVVFDCGGYWVSGTATGRYTLHLIRYKEYGMENPGISTLNFVIKNFDGKTLSIETYDGNGIAEFVKSNSAGTEAINADAPEAEVTTYDINGLPVENPTAPGIYIQSDGKKFAK